MFDIGRDQTHASLMPLDGSPTVWIRPCRWRLLDQSSDGNPAIIVGHATLPRFVICLPPTPLHFLLDRRMQVQETAMKSKTQQIREALAVDDPIGALRIAARFFDRSADTKTFKRGIDAFNNPDFYRQLGKRPEQITQDALKTLADRFGLR